MPDTPLSDSSLRKVLDSIADAVVVVDQDGIIQFANPAAAAMFQRPISDMVGTTFTYPLDVETTTYIDIAASAGDNAVGEMRVTRLEWAGAPGLLASIRDVSARRRDEDLHRQVLYADKRAAIAKLAATFAHEINNAAAFTLANLTVMKDIFGDFEAAFEESRISRAIMDKYRIQQSIDDLREMVKDNEGGIERLGSFVRKFQSMAQQKQRSIELIDVNKLVTRTCEIAADLMHGRARLVCELGRIPQVAGDRFRLMQVVFNLLRNAAAAITEGPVAQQQIKVVTTADVEAVRIAISDTGRGIPASRLDTLFQPMSGVADEASRIGWGLPIVAEIVEDHNGHLTVTSNPGEGTCFEVWLPRETGLTLTETSRARVLLVEEDASMRRSYGRMLESVYDLVAVASGEAALERIAADRNYDAVLCSLIANGMDGPAIHAALTDRAPELAARLIFISGGTHPPRIQRFVDAVAATVLEKPVSRPVLCDAIDRVRP